MIKKFPRVDPEGWLVTLFWHRIQISRFGGKYKIINQGKQYAVQFFGKLWRMG